MKKSRYTDVQIAFTLKQAETGTPVAEAARLQTADGCNPPSHDVYNADQPPKALGAKMNECLKLESGEADTNS